MNAELVNEFDLLASGGGKGLLGDIDGDGRMELVIVQADDGIDDRYIPHQITCITAYRLNGELLWQTGEPQKSCGTFGSDFPAQVYDIDQDGKLELLCVMNKEFVILNGSDGTVKQKYPLPAEHAHDCIIIANLRGLAQPQDIILKDRYRNLWALTGRFELLWTHSGNVGHYPWVYDINGDGFDEVMAGYDMLDHTGKRLWSCKNLEDHADCLWIGDVNGDGRPEVVVGGSVTCLYTAAGQELWRYEGSVESQHLALGRFVPELPGLQVAGLDRIRRGDGHKGQWDGKDGMFLLDCSGRELWKEERSTDGWLTIVETISNWNKEQRDYILAYRRGGGVLPGLYDGTGKCVVVFPRDGYVLHADLFGRGIEDVIVYTKDKASVFSGAAFADAGQRSGVPLAQSKRLYSSTLYPGGEYPDQ